MNLRAVVRIVLLMSIAAGLGAIGGYAVAKRENATLHDIATAFRVLDLNNRLDMLRLLRERAISADKAQSIEISALVLLDTIPLDEITGSSSSCYVLRTTAKRLAAYMHDFPDSEFVRQRKGKVAQLVTMSACK